MLLKSSFVAFSIAAIFTVPANAEDNGAQKLHGIWVGIHENDKEISLTFGPKDTIKVRVGEEIAQGRYSVGWSEAPAHLDIDWGKRGMVETIIELQGDSLKFENVQPGGERPEMFTNKSKTLKRHKGERLG